VIFNVFFYILRIQMRCNVYSDLIPSPVAVTASRGNLSLVILIS
jgi:hypothetical protein